MFREGSRFDAEFEADTEQEGGMEVEDVILEAQQDILSGVDLAPHNSVTLNGIFDSARATYEKDAKAWDNLFGNLSSELGAAIDDDEAEAILDQYRRKAANLG
jgi:hypothetical protein